MLNQETRFVMLTADDAFMHAHVDYAFLHFLAQDFCPITNISFMVNGENAAKATKNYRRFKRGDVAFGLHLTLINLGETLLPKSVFYWQIFFDNYLSYSSLIKL